MIKAVNISHSYSNDIALKDINFEIKKGEFVAIVGESGSGKSTLLSILSTLLKASSGEIFSKAQILKILKILTLSDKKILVLYFNFIT